MTEKEISELEKTVLGSIIQKESIIDSHFLDKHIDAYYFSDKRNQLIYANLLQMHFSGVAINEISLVQYLAVSNQLSSCGNASYIADIRGDGFPSNIDFYIEQLQEVFLRKKTIELLKTNLEKIKGLPKLTNDDVNTIISDFSVLTEIAETTKFYTTSDLYEEAKKNILKNIENKNPTGILSGFSLFDDVTDGFQKGELSIIGARPSIGKTSLALSMCMNISKTNTVAFISLETPATMIAYKILGLITDTAIFKLRKGFLTTQNQEDLFKNRTNEIINRNFYLVDKTSVDITELKSIIRRLVIQYKTEIVFIDYIGLINAGSQNMPVYEKQSIVSKSLKEFAREFNIAICALCQVARGAESAGKPPLLSDLRGSGSIEQDADVVMFIHGERIIPKNDATTKRSFIIAKNRNGECTAGDIVFTKSTAKYSNEGEA